jgi:hypothetical protein
MLKKIYREGWCSAENRWKSERRRNVTDWSRLVQVARLSVILCEMRDGLSGR